MLAQAGSTAGSRDGGPHSLDRPNSNNPGSRKMAAEANLSLFRQHAAVILARQAAETAVKRRIQREGRVKLSTIAHATLTRLANEWLRQHPELLAEATRIAVRMSGAQCPCPRGNLRIGNEGRATMSIIAYARVSTDGQSLESQQAALTAAGAERVFAEKISGAVTDRKALTRAIAELGPGGLLAGNAARPVSAGEGYDGR